MNDVTKDEITSANVTETKADNKEVSLTEPATDGAKDSEQVPTVAPKVAETEKSETEQHEGSHLVLASHDQSASIDDGVKRKRKSLEEITNKTKKIKSKTQDRLKFHFE